MASAPAAFLQCRAFAIDSERTALAIVLGPTMLAGDGSGFSGLTLGEYLGAVLGAPRHDAKAEPASLPDSIGATGHCTFARLRGSVGDDVFFPKGAYVASNRIADRNLEMDRSSRFDKYKSELKKFMFNPGQEIASVPLIGDQLDIFTAEMAPHYDYLIDDDYREGRPCWVFSALATPFSPMAARP